MTPRCASCNEPAPIAVELERLDRGHALVRFCPSCARDLLAAAREDAEHAKTRQHGRAAEASE